MIEIDSNDVISDPDLNFRVAAGPGAGKTHWLAQHILGIIRNPERLGKVSKVACITYTNIGAETVVRRLGAASKRAEVSTVHSFFYQNVVKPYLGFIAEEIGIDLTKVDGHDETILSDYTFLKKWKDDTGQKYLKDNEKIVKALGDLSWTRAPDGNIALKFKPKKFHKIGKYSLKTTSFLVYKKMAWARGTVHHDDVLYFTYKIFTRYPFLLTVLRSRYPYFFVDEFQDSNPLQVEIFRLLAESGIFVGIIGDVAQSIYGFNGASPLDFKAFEAPNIGEYVMRQNRRSSNEIIAALNSIRLDIEQVPFRDANMGLPSLLIGTMAQSLVHAQRECEDEPIVTLSRNNATANLMKRSGVAPQQPTDLIFNLISFDSTTSRRETIVSCVKAVEFARQSNFSNAVREMAKALRNSATEEIAEKRKVEILLKLAENRPTYESKTLSEFAKYLRTTFNLQIPGISSGKPKEFYEKYAYSDLAACVNVAEDYSNNRTIHKAKGDEFDNVLLLLGETNMLDLLLAPNLLSEKSEEQRVIYVGMSRAKNRLFINVPELSADQRQKLGKSFSIVDVG